MSRRRAREAAFKVLFQVDQVDNAPGPAFEHLLEEWPLSTENKEFAWQLIEGTLREQQELDRGIMQYASREWSLGRMAPVDRCLLRLAAFEMLCADAPQAPAVVIDEALELAKRYSEAGSVAFINAILDRMKR
ncbi:MAG: transcription antitermination factor NusB [Syntrophomonadaceae bacterium]|nr:transcription antitermination factor NusB [Syntrophomonadaceae bacterium]